MGLILNFALFAVLIVTLKNPTTALKCAHPIRANQTIVFNTVTDSMKKLIVYRHNYYRKAIMAGKVPGQPKGINIKMLVRMRNILY